MIKSGLWEKRLQNRPKVTKSFGWKSWRTGERRKKEATRSDRPNKEATLTGKTIATTTDNNPTDTPTDMKTSKTLVNRTELVETAVTKTTVVQRSSPNEAAVATADEEDAKPTPTVKAVKVPYLPVVLTIPEIETKSEKGQFLSYLSFFSFSNFFLFF